MIYYIAIKTTFSSGTNMGNSKQPARWVHLAPLGSQSQDRICFILPTRGYSHIIKTYTGKVTFIDLVEEKM